MSEENKKKNQIYDAHSIKVMEGLEAVRKRPGMYIGSTDIKGLHHLVYEVADNSVDESLAGYCKNIKVTLKSDGACVIEDDGRGIPIDIHPVEGISAAEVVMTKLHAGGKFDKNTYAFSGGLHGVGVSVVNALSKYLKLTIYKNNKIYVQEYEYGVPLYSLKVIGEIDKHGTTIEFIPDEKIFVQTQSFSYDILSKRFKEVAFLNKGLCISLINENDGQEVRHQFDDGIISFVEDLVSAKEPLFKESIYFSHKEEVLEIDMAMQYTNDYTETLISFVNTINTHEGGTHVSGFKSALTATCNKKAKEFKYDEIFTSDDLREGLVCVLSIKVADPQFEGQTKAKLSNFEVKGVIQSYLSDFLSSYFEENPNIIKKILDKAELARKAREAAKRARDLTRKKSGIDSSILPGKLADCSSTEPENNELFIVEGNSAGGSAKMGRDRSIQAILPLRGKILNVEKTSLDKMLSNSEIKSLVAAIGTGFGNDSMNIDDCRYHKVIIMTDADVDGSHICTLLLTFFFKYMRPIIEKGYLYIAQPPLYKVKIGRKEKYLKSDNELFEVLLSWISDEVRITVDDQDIDGVKKSNFITAVSFFLKYIYTISQEMNYVIEEIEKVFIQNVDAVEARYEDIIEKFPTVYFSKREYVENYNNLIFSKEMTFWYKQKIVEKVSFSSIIGFSLFIKDIAKPYMMIQRYKGLGEMNEDQLWSTAMDPKNRQLKKLQVSDFVDTEGWVSLLMGEEVAPRRQFIEDNALKVKNLDV